MGGGPGFAAGRLEQLDALKAFAIACVILHHGLSEAVLADLGGLYWIKMAVPVFIVLMAVNYVLGSRGHARPSRLSAVYDRAALTRRFRRLGIPFAVTFAVALVLALVEGAVQLRGATLVGLLPYGGPGNYFIPLAFQVVLLLPVLAWCYGRHRWLTIGACFALNAGWEVAVPHINSAGVDPFLTQAAVFGFLAELAVGLWIVQGLREGPRHNRLVLVAGAGGLIYLIGLLQGWWWLSVTNFEAAPYAGALVVLGVWLLPERSPAAAWQALTTVGRASWHIYLVQILWFGVLGTAGDGSRIALDLVVCIALGVLFARVVPGTPRSARGGIQVRREPVTEPV